MATLKEALDQLAKGHELDNEQKKLIIDKWQKELGIQPCGDAISREDAILALDEIFDSVPMELTTEILALRTALRKKLPSVQPLPKTGHWIPVSERLPEYGKEVLTCSNGGFIEIQSLEDGDYWENQKGDWTDFDEVIAWSPLPEPYEPQESE